MRPKEAPAISIQPQFETTLAVDLELGKGPLIKMLDERCSPRHGHEHTNIWGFIAKLFI
jgi:hypothetical protein